MKKRKPAAAAAKTGRGMPAGEPGCSFCGRGHREVAKLVGGPGVFICAACVGLCNDILAGTAADDVTAWPGWQSMSDEDLLASLPGTLASVERVRAGLQARIDELRRREVSWARIGEALGMSRQAAWERFA